VTAVDRIGLYLSAALGLSALAAHVAGVTLTKALRAYSRSRLEDLCGSMGRRSRADEVAHHDQRTERAAESLAVITGLVLAAWLGVAADRLAPAWSLRAGALIALAVGGVGYVLAGVVGKVYAERVIDAAWPLALPLRVLTGPLTWTARQVEALVEHLARPRDSARRPSSVEVEIPADEDHPGDEEADLPETTLALLRNAVELTRRDVSELMTPRSAIVTLPSSVTAREAARVFRETGKSRVPLYGENRDDVVGILYAKDLFPRMTDVADADTVIPRTLARTPYCVPETKNAFDLLEEFRRERTQIAIVLDEYGGVAGLATLEDLLEELVGAIDDEHDVPTPGEPVVPLGGTRFEVDATLSLEDLNERLKLRFPTDGDFQTVGGFTFHALGRLPEPGATFRHNGVEVEVLEVADHSIRRVGIDLHPAEAVGTP